jgi:hypothetical protein
MMQHGEIEKPCLRRRRTMMRRNTGIGVGLLTFCAVLLAIGGCSFSRNECDDTKISIDALARTYSGIDPEKAYGECKNALAKCPKIVSGYKLMGTIDMANNNYPSAIANYSQAFELDSKDPEVASALRRLSMYSVALTGTKIEIDGKKIIKQPFRMVDITLKEYSQIDPAIRLLWLRSSLDDVSKKTAEAMKKNPNAELTGSMAVYAEEIDRGILSEVEANSNGKVGDAFQKYAMDAATKHLTVRAVRK